MKKVKSFSDALAELERAADEAGPELRRRLEEELSKLKPHVEEIKAKLNEGLHEGKERLEREVQKNPLAALGVVAIFFFILGLILSPRRSRRSD